MNDANAKPLPSVLRRSRPSFEVGVSLTMFLVVAVLAIFELSGSSVGSFHRAFEGTEIEDPDLLAGEPRGIRSDEWLRWTTLVVSQSQQDYPRINTALRDGIDLSIIDDVPHRGWTAFFEPQHYAFFTGIDVESAFSFKWFGILAYCFVSASIFARRVGGLRPSSSALAGLFLAGSPFFQWWFQGQAYLPTAHALMLLTVVHASLQSETLRHRYLLGLAGGYLASAALIVQYPPFLLSVAFPSAVFMMTMLWMEARTTSWASVARRTGPTIGSTIGIVSAVGLAFVISKRDLIERVSDSEFPGGRSFVSGLGDLRFLTHVLSGNLATNFLDDQRASLYFTNQSEASSFFVLLPFLAILVLAVSLSRHRRQEPPDVVMLGLTAFTALVGVWLFVPGVSAVFTPFLFSQIPLYRFVLMIGITQFLLLVRLVGSIEQGDLRVPPVTASLVSAIALAVTVIANRVVIEDNPGFVDGRTSVLVTTLLMAGGLALILFRQTRAGLAALGVLTVLASAGVNPLYRGLAPVLDTPIVDRIEAISEADGEGVWVTNGGLFFENLAVQAGARSLSGSAPHTQAPFWRSEFSSDADQEAIFDRAAHFVFSFTDEPTSLNLDAVNVVAVAFNPCGSFAEKAEVKYLVSVRPLDFPCLSLSETVPYTRITFHIYERD